MNFSGPIEDRLAIRELCDQYADASMRRDVAAWADTWAEDASWLRSDGASHGRAAITAVAQAMMGSYTAARFLSSIGSTQVDGDRARGHCHLVEFFVFNKGGAQYFLSRYDDEYVKIDGRWYFKQRAFTLELKGAA